MGEGGGREGGGGEGGVDPGIGCLFTGSWILDGNKVKMPQSVIRSWDEQPGVISESVETILMI